MRRGSFKVEVVMPRVVTEAVKKLSAAGMGEFVSGVAHDIGVGLAEFMDRASRSRHKTADRFGVEPSGLLEFPHDCPSRSRGGAEIYSRRNGYAASVYVRGIPFLNRAFGDVVVTPKKASALTIPISRESYRHTAAEMRSLGYVLFTKGRGRRRNAKASGILFGKRGSRTVPLYRLARRARLPMDAGLLPSSDMISEWAVSSARKRLEVAR